MNSLPLNYSNFFYFYLHSNCSLSHFCPLNYILTIFSLVNCYFYGTALLYALIYLFVINEAANSKKFS